jgi:hypothetical protein
MANGSQQLASMLQSHLARKHQAGMLESQQAAAAQEFQASLASREQEHAQAKDMTLRGWERQDNREQRDLKIQLAEAVDRAAMDKARLAAEAREKQLEMAGHLLRDTLTTRRQAMLQNDELAARASEGRQNRASNERIAGIRKGAGAGSADRDPMYQTLRKQRDATYQALARMESTGMDAVTGRMMAPQEADIAKANARARFEAAEKSLQEYLAKRGEAPAPPPAGAAGGEQQAGPSPEDYL